MLHYLRLLALIGSVVGVATFVVFCLRKCIGLLKEVLETYKVGLEIKKLRADQLKPSGLVTDGTGIDRMVELQNKWKGLMFKLLVPSSHRDMMAPTVRFEKEYSEVDAVIPFESDARNMFRLFVIVLRSSETRAVLQVLCICLYYIGMIAYIYSYSARVIADSQRYAAPAAQRSPRR